MWLFLAVNYVKTKQIDQLCMYRVIGYTFTILLFVIQIFYMKLTFMDISTQNIRIGDVPNRDFYGIL